MRVQHRQTQIGRCCTRRGSEPRVFLSQPQPRATGHNQGQDARRSSRPRAWHTGYGRATGSERDPCSHDIGSGAPSTTTSRACVSQRFSFLDGGD